MVKEKVTIKNPTGLHLRPAGRLCDGARKYRSKITFQKGNKTDNAKVFYQYFGVALNQEMK